MLVDLKVLFIAVKKHLRAAAVALPYEPALQPLNAIVWLLYVEDTGATWQHEGNCPNEA